MESHVGVKVEEEGRSIIIMEKESKEKEKFPKGLTFTHTLPHASIVSSFSFSRSQVYTEAKHKSKITSKPLISPIDGFYFLLQ